MQGSYLTIQGRMDEQHIGNVWTLWLPSPLTSWRSDGEKKIRVLHNAQSVLALCLCIWLPSANPSFQPSRNLKNMGVSNMEGTHTYTLPLCPSFPALDRSLPSWIAHTGLLTFKEEMFTCPFGGRSRRFCHALAPNERPRITLGAQTSQLWRIKVCEHTASHNTV